MKIRFSASGFDMDVELEKYASSKVAHVGKQIPRKLRAGAMCEVEFQQTHTEDTKFSTCGITLVLAGTELKARETTQHMYAALDIAAVHIEQQLADYEAARSRKPIREHIKRSFRSDWQ